MLTVGAHLPRFPSHPCTLVSHMVPFLLVDLVVLLEGSLHAVLLSWGHTVRNSWDYYPYLGCPQNCYGLGSKGDSLRSKITEVQASESFHGYSRLNFYVPFVSVGFSSLSVSLHNYFLAPFVKSLPSIALVLQTYWGRILLLWRWWPNTALWVFFWPCAIV